MIMKILKREKTQKTTIGIKRGDITTGSTDIERKVREVYANKFDDLGETYRFLERHRLPKLTQKEIDNLSSPITIKEIEFVFHNLPQRTPGLDSFTGEFH